MTKIFISYRRTQAFIAERVHERLSSVFRDDSLFLDRGDIRPGAEYPQVLRDNLQSAAVVLAVIDSDWISVQDKRTFMRRLELQDDWVRQEIEHGLDNGIVIPVLIDGAPMPTVEQLPPSLQALAKRQYIRISLDRFADDVNALILEVKTRLSEKQLEALLKEEAHPYPKANDFTPFSIEGELLEKMLRQLVHWRYEISTLKDDPRPGTPPVRHEIVRDFRFSSFLKAIEFMATAAEPIDAFGHHPRWENIFKTVRISLSSWDIGHKPSDRDFKTAIMLEKLYEKFISLEAVT